MNFIDELKRRNVFRVGIAYLAASWLLIQILETLFPVFGIAEMSIRWVVIVLAIGLIPTVVIAWIFELTPSGLRRESEVDRSISTTQQTGRRLDGIIIGVLCLALVYFAADKFLFSPSRERENIQTAREEGAATAKKQVELSPISAQSIAVLPFLDLTPAHDYEYFADGIAEELLNLLARIPQLHVAARTSSFSFRGKDIQIHEIAKQLRVAHILEGSVRKFDDKLRITVQLIAADNGYHLWSETFDATIGDIFEIQDDIAGKVVSALKIELVEDLPRVATTSSEAYPLFLQARHFARQGTAEGHARAEALLHEALGIDSGYAPTWALLASVYVGQASKGMKPIVQGHELAREAAAQALAIDPDSAGVMSLLAWISMIYDWNFAESERLLSRALLLEPHNLSALNSAAAIALNAGRFEEAIELYRRIIDRNPITTTGYFSLAYTLYASRRFGESIAYFNQSLALSPGVWGAHYFISLDLLFDNRPEEALREIEKETLRAFQLTGYAHILHALGDRAASDEALDELIEDHAAGYAYQIASTYAFRGQLDLAFEWLDIAFANHDGGMTRLRIEPPLDNLRSDPRYDELLQRVDSSNLSE